MCEEISKGEIQNENTDEKVVVKKKRGRKPSSTKKGGYFGDEEEDAFKKYLLSTSEQEKNEIFREKLYPILYKMVEAISRRYGLFTPSESFEDTFADTLSFLMTKVNNFDPTKGFKAYSYCGTICKRYLLLKRTQDMKRRDNTLSYDSFFSGKREDDRINNDNHEISFYGELINKTIEQIQDMIDPNGNYGLTDNEISVGYALLEILLNWEDIFVRIESKKFNKTSVYYFIKEYTMLSTKDIRDAMKRYKNLYLFTKKTLIES